MTPRDIIAKFCARFWGEDDIPLDVVDVKFADELITCLVQEGYEIRLVGSIQDDVIDAGKLSE